MPAKPKLTIAQIGEIRRRAAEPNPPTQAKLAEDFGVGITTIKGVLKQIAVPGAMPPADKNTADEADAGSGPIIMLSTAEIVTSSLNPRRTFDEQALAELASSIAANGLLQNLVVRAAENGFYQIVAGERRFRAIRYLEENGQWNEKFPCRVITGDAGVHLAIALLENLNRVDVPPLEEAEAFLQLHAIDKEIWSTAAIAARIGKSTRYVQQRMALALKLSAEAKQALRDGRLKIEAARVLAQAPAAQQGKIIEEIEENGEALSVNNIRFEIDVDPIHVSAALFDAKNCGLDTITDEGEDFFVDVAAFWELQKAAVEARRVELAKRFAWVDVYGPDEIYPRKYILGDDAPPESRGATINMRPDGTVNFDDYNGIGLVRIETSKDQDAGEQDEPDQSDVSQADDEPDQSDVSQADDEPDQSDVSQADDEPTAPDDAPTTTETVAFALTPPGKVTETETKGPPVTKAHIYHAHRRKTEALRAAVAKNHTLALRITTYALLSHTVSGPVTIHAGFTSYSDDKTPLTPEHERAITAFLGKTKIPQFYDRAADLKLWRTIESMPVDKLEMLFAVVVARSVATPAGAQCELGDDPIALAIAHVARLPGNEDDHGLTVDREDLNGVRKAGLLGMADEAGTPGINDELAPGVIADAIAKKSSTYVLPTMRFATTAEIEKALKFK